MTDDETCGVAADELLAPAAGEPTELITRAWALVRAQERMADRWAESDASVRKDLWQQLHRAGNELRETLEMFN